MPTIARNRAKLTPFITRALRRAKANNAAYIVAEMDHEDTRRPEVHPLSYADTDEFFAFGGYILHIAHADGSID